MPKTTLKPGDRIGYTAKHLRNTGNFSNAAAKREGTFRGYDVCIKGFVRVDWDDIEDVISQSRAQYADSEYVRDVQENGSLVDLKSVTRLGSARHRSSDT